MMTPMKKCAVVLVAGVALGLLSAKIAMSADGSDRAPRGNDLWDAGAPLPGGNLGQLALRQPDGFGPPGPPRNRDDDGPPPPRRERGPGMDSRMPPGPPSGDERRLPPDRDARGSDGARLRPPMSPEQLKHEDPELFGLLKADMEMERYTHEMAMEYRRAPKDQQGKIKQQIEELVNKHFDVRQQRRTLELKHLEEELQRLRDAMDRRAKSRKEVVEKRVSELTGSEDDMRF